MMFKFNEANEVVDISLVDFQLSFWASPASDLLYFLFSSVADEHKIDHFDDFIEYYHEELATSLKKLKYDKHIPTLAELHVDLLAKGSFGKLI